MHLVTIRGTRFSINVYFLLLVTLLAAAGRFQETMLLLLTVILHEMAHVVVARGMGLTVTEIELLPFGGVARIDDLMYADAKTDILVTAAGPAVNIIIWSAMWLMRPFDVMPPELLDALLKMNMVIGLFNLIPALPLDGGRLFRAWLGTRQGYREATRIAARLGRVLALLIIAIGGAGLYYGLTNVTVILLGVFIFLAAGKEESDAQFVLMRYMTRKQAELKEAGCMQVLTLTGFADVPMKDVIRRFSPQRYHLVWVLNQQGKVLGCVSEAEIFQTMLQKGIDCLLHEAIAPNSKVV